MTPLATPPSDPGFLTNVIMGAWALGGSMARGMTDWKDPVTGKFTIWRMIAGLVTALVLGEIAIAASKYFNVSQEIAGALAAVLGYLGPAATIGIITTRFEVKDASGKNHP